MLELAALATSKRSYGEALAEEGAAALAGLTAFLASAALAGDEEGMEAAAAVLAAAGGDAASGGGDIELSVSLASLASLAASSAADAAPSPAPLPRPLPLRRVPSRRRIRLSQASLGDGLGARLWAAAPALLAALDGTRPPKEREETEASEEERLAGTLPSSVSPPPLRGASVLELGCGTGAGALACVALGAAAVAMTDGERRVLEVARGGVARTLLRWARERRQEEGPEEPSVSSGPRSRHRCCWDDPGGKLSIRRLWWGDGAKKRKRKKEEEKEEKEEQLSRGGGGGGAAFPACERRGGGGNGDDDDDDDEEPLPPCAACAAAGPPHLDDDGGEEEGENPQNTLFDVVVAADVLYDESSAPALAAEVAARLARAPSPRWVSEQQQQPSPPPRPAAFFACPVREARFLDDLLEAARAEGLAATALRDDEALDRARQGVRGAGRARDYEGGFAFVKMEWA